LNLQRAKIIQKENEKNLWTAYKKKGCEESRNGLIINYQPLVYRELGSLSFRPDQRLDLIQEGTVGLIEAVDGFCPERNFLFSTFARYRIRGRMLNYLERKMENYPYEDDWEDKIPGDEDLQGDVETLFLTEELKKNLAWLPTKEREVLESLVIKDLPAQEVASRLSVTTSYLYRLRKKALRRLRGKMSKLMSNKK